jgi:hypothetical protein
MQLLSDAERHPPLETDAELPVIVQLLRIPHRVPPPEAATLCMMAQLVSLHEAAPPPSDAELPVSVQLLSVQL